jgi:CheY-like chemotaxis protein
MPTVRILVVDDHAVRRTMCSLLFQDSTLDVICETASGEEAVIKACEHQPDLFTDDIGSERSENARPHCRDTRGYRWTVTESRTRQ